MNVFLFAIGAIDPITDKEAADRAIEFIMGLPGFVAVHPNPEYTLLCFDTLDNAITSRGIYTETGNQAGRYIMNAVIDRDTLQVNSPAWDSQGGNVQ